MSDVQQIIIGEAAYNLLMRHEEVSVAALLTELARMAKSQGDAQRQQQIGLAKQWLLNHRTPAEKDNRVSSLLRGMSRREGSVRMPPAGTEENE